jgi:hypothetical protein
MTKDELVRHLRAVHGSKITEPRWTTKAELESAHAEYHVRERAASDGFIRRGNVRAALAARSEPDHERERQDAYAKGWADARAVIADRLDVAYHTDIGHRVSTLPSECPRCIRDHQAAEYAPEQPE